MGHYSKVSATEVQQKSPNLEKI